jgi:predicted acylesterase/phospholipase RssA/CRP-like cAMP-binding protein
MGVTVDDIRQAGLDWIFHASFLGQLAAPDRAGLLAAARWRDFSDGDRLITSGEMDAGIFLLVAGDALVMAPERKGERVLAHLGPGHLVGERSGARGEPASATVRASGPVRALYAPAPAFAALLARSDALRAHVEGLIALRARSADILRLLLRDPILRALGREDLERLLQSGAVDTVPAGGRIVEAGTTGEADVYMVVSGEVAVYAPAPEGQPRERLTTQGPGWLFGHVPLLLELPRTADVEAVRRTEVLRIGARAFMHAVSRNPPLRRRLYESLARLDLPTEAIGKHMAQPLVVGLWASRPGMGVTTLAYALAGTLRGAGGVVLVDAEGEASAARLGLPVTSTRLGEVAARRVSTPEGWQVQVLAPEGGAQAVPALIDAARRGMGPTDRLVVAMAPTRVPMPEVLARLQTLVHVRHAEDPHWSASGGTMTRVEAVRLATGHDLPLALSRNAVRIPHDPGAGERFWGGADLDSVQDPGRPSGRAVARLARVLQGRTIGVALGGGGALGFGHIALLRAMEEAELPVDVVAGVSFGALVGGLYAAGGLPLLNDLIRSASTVQRLVRVGHATLSPLRRWVDHLTHGARLETTEIPFFAVSADVLTGREIVHSAGRISRAVRASWAMPGLTPAFRVGATRLVDGGIVNSVPASVVWDAGADFIVASNPCPVIPQRGEVGLFRGRVEDILRATVAMTTRIGRDRAAIADFLFELDGGEVGLSDYRRAGEIHDRALDLARAKIDLIRHRREMDTSMRPEQEAQG